VKYLLNHFNINFNGYAYSRIWKFKKKIEKFKKKNETLFSDYEDVYNSPSTYKEQIKDLNGNIYLDGYWGNENYFVHNEKIIKDDLQVKNLPDQKNKEILKKISSVNSVAVSVRRGDYLNPYFKAQFGFCTLDYYKKAIKEISNKVENPIFYIFSDDPEWVEKNIKLGHRTVYISHNYKKKEYWEDIRLISSCKHFIMGNSTFSWWGSWLSKNKSKIVIGPEPWLNSYTSKDMMPKTWKKIKCDRSEIFENSKHLVYKIENVELKKNEVLQIKQKPRLIENEKKKDNIIKILINTEKATLLKISDEKIPPILISFERGISTRYIYLDRNINISNINIISDTQIKTIDLEIRNVKDSISKKYTNQCEIEL
jgi:hypothetical protein